MRHDALTGEMRIASQTRVPSTVPFRDVYESLCRLPPFDMVYMHHLVRDGMRG